MTLIQLCSCLYLAAKVNEFELVKIRDIINVVQFTLTTESNKAALNIQEIEDEEMLDEQARHKQLLAHIVVTEESRISMADYAALRERILE